MKKCDNFKIYFSSILSEKLKLNKEEIDKYFELKKRHESFEKKKFIGTIIGLSELVSSALVGVVYDENHSMLIIPVIILGGVGFLTTKISVTRKNPYCLKEYKEIDFLYGYEKAKYKTKK